ncbi:hypothetical protein EVAR_86405_1 [Eumeta japonica]|uniref:Uncharacterized protein n=1 Tax=Eumeta variegata TaxID=151549 RepID=A0A4C1W7Y3_EUMVA|nr:hypothetical protein EVAR_86405_1 [Eumeta japonica]
MVIKVITKSEGWRVTRTCRVLSNVIRLVLDPFFERKGLLEELIECSRCPRLQINTDFYFQKNETIFVNFSSGKRYLCYVRRESSYNLQKVRISRPVLWARRSFDFVVLTKQLTCRLCAAAVFLLLGRIGGWSRREIARFALSLARSAKAQRYNERLARRRSGRPPPPHIAAAIYHLRQIPSRIESVVSNVRPLPAIYFRYLGGAGTPAASFQPLRRVNRA